jgi:predicted transcriptional regulator
MTAYGTELFSMNDVNHLKILQDVIERNLRPGQAAEMLGITPRHCSRLLKRYRQSGPLGMNNQRQDFLLTRGSRLIL